jgi:hypothetical protein
MTLLLLRTNPRAHLAWQGSLEGLRYASCMRVVAQAFRPADAKRSPVNSVDLTEESRRRPAAGYGKTFAPIQAVVRAIH